MSRFRLVSVVIFAMCVWSIAQGSPFELTKQYVDHFKQSLAELVHMAQHHQQQIQQQYQHHQQQHMQKHTTASKVKEDDVADLSSSTSLLQTETPAVRAAPVVEAAESQGQRNAVLDAAEHAMRDAEDFDFVIVGGGTSGAVLANRLSEVPEWKVLLLEAGAPETIATQVPRMQPYLLGTPYNWHYLTTPQHTWCQGNLEKRCMLPAGRALGGSSAINTMIYSRGNAHDFDQWSDQENHGWCFRDVLPYFKKAEDAHLKHYDRSFHSHGGPLHIEHPQNHPEMGPHLSFLKDTSKSEPRNSDYNGAKQLGWAVPLQVTTKDGKRYSTAQAYLGRAAQHRANLVIRPYSKAIKVLMGAHTKEAHGIQYLHKQEGKKQPVLRVARAHKEVILAAGAIQSAYLLMKSGLGPKEHLAEHGIEVLTDMPIGKHLRDHVAFVGLDFTASEPHNHSIIDKPHHHDDEAIQYLKEGKGPLTGSGVEAIAFLQLPNTKRSKQQPDYELIISALPRSQRESMLRSYGLPTQDSKEHKEADMHLLNFAIVLLHPKSHGSVSLNIDHNISPAIDLNALSEHEDFKDLKMAVKHTIDWAKKAGLHLVEHSKKLCPEVFDSDEFWECALRKWTVSVGHMSGTCRMGPHSDPHAVVTANLTVYGTEHLRVVDASVIPVTISGHIMATNVMIAEKGAELIKHHWK